MLCAVCRQMPARKDKRTCGPCGYACIAQVRRMDAQTRPIVKSEPLPYAAGRPRRGYGTTWRYPKVRRTSNFVASVMYEYNRVRLGYKKH